MNIEALQNSYHRDINVDTNVLPFGRFSRERLLKAKQLLEEMGSVHVFVAQTDWTLLQCEECGVALNGFCYTEENVGLIAEWRLLHEQCGVA